MEIIKTTAKTTLNIKTTITELRSLLGEYQQDQLLDLMREFCSGENIPGSVIRRGDAARFAVICMENGKEFSDLVEKTDTPWLPTPAASHGTDGWIEALINYPYIFSITDDVATDDVGVIFVTFTDTGIIRNVSALIDNI